MLEKLDIPMGKMNYDPYLKSIMALICTVNLLKESINYLWPCRDKQKAQTVKDKSDKLTIKIKNFCSSEKNKKMKSQVID